jgi:hypothetical protein
VNGDITTSFPASLAPGTCGPTVTITHTVVAGDPDPLVDNTTATYQGVVADASASSTGTTNLFQPRVAVTKTCAPNPIAVGQAEVCTIHVTNTSSSDAPNLVNGTITDSLNGNLLAAGNTAVTASTCTATLATGASCQITTSRVVLATDPNPLVNTVTVHYNPAGGFTNDIHASATASVTIHVVTQQCTLGFWKVPQHFHFWVGFMTSQKFSAVFGVTITLVANGSTPAIHDPTLLQALQAGGGGINSLARHAVAALLNASSLQNPTFTTAQVISMVQTAIANGPAAIQALADKFDAEQQADHCTGFINT